MKSNKDRILDFIRLQSVSGYSKGISTQDIAEALKIGRTNVSSLLNDLVQEGRVAKENGRPVLYQLAQEEENAEHDCFANMIGSDGSLQQAIRLAKAALIYPGNGLNTLLVGDQGVGKSFLAMLMHRFTTEAGILSANAPFVVLDCREYQENDAGLAEELSLDNESGAICTAKGGILHIDNAQFLSPGNRCKIGQICAFADSQPPQERTIPLLIVACDRSNKAAIEYFEKALPVTITLPPLTERPLSERMALIQSFLTLEAARAKRTIVLNAELFRCLLLYDCAANNILKIKADIKKGSAAAYLREYNNKQDRLYLYITDFDPIVRKGFLQYREHRAEIEQLIPEDYCYEFSESTMEMSAIDRAKLLSGSLYDEINRRTDELLARGMTESEVKTMLSIEYEALFHRYWNASVKQVVNKEQLVNLVAPPVIQLVENFLNDAASRTGTVFPPSVFYGLCLHVSALLKNDSPRHSFSSQQISDIVELHGKEYALALDFSGRFEKAFQNKLPLDEVMLITMFLSTETQPEEVVDKPIILLALHGGHVASSLSDCINGVVGADNIFALDIPFEESPEDTYVALKDCVGRIRRGTGGIVVLYDMDFIGQILDSIAQETGVQIRAMSFPIPLIGIEWSRRAVLAEDTDSLFSGMMQSLNLYQIHFPRVIVALCTTGEGGAQELKSYIERYGKADDIEIVAMAGADREKLKAELSELQKRALPVCIVGTQDPKLFNIPFVSIADVLSCSTAVLPEVLRGKNREKKHIDIQQVFDYLEEQFEYADARKLRKLLPPIVEQFNESVISMSIDTEIGLLMHIACSINRLCSGASTPQNLRREDIIFQHGEAYRTLRKELKPLEKAFRIIFPDDELANILMIIFKL